MAIQNLTRFVEMRGTKADVLGFTASLEEAAFAYTIDTNEFGVYTSGTWTWVGVIHSWGSMYQDDTGTVITVAAINTDYMVTGMSQGIVSHMTFQNGRELMVSIAGIYKVDWSLSITVAGANQEVEGAVGVGGVRNATTSSHAKLLTGSDTVTIGGTGLLSLAANALVQIVVRNETATNNISIEHANLSLMYLGSAP